MINELFEQMILQVQGQPVLQVMTILSFVSCFEKWPQGSEISAKVIVNFFNKLHQ